MKDLFALLRSEFARFALVAGLGLGKVLAAVAEFELGAVGQQLHVASLTCPG